METVPVMLAEYAKRRKRIVEGLRAIPGVTCEWPGGAFYAFPNISAHLSSAPGKPALAKRARNFSKCSWRKCKWPSCRAKPLAHQATCGSPTPPPSSESTKGFADSNVFSLALKPRPKP